MKMGEDVTGVGETATVLNSSAPAVSDEAARDILRRYFGIAASVAGLTSERDSNFRVLAEDGRKYVLKIANSAEPTEVTKFQSSALSHIEGMDGDLPVPRVVPTRDGASDMMLDLGSERPNVVRLLTYLEGTPLHRIKRSAVHRRNIAACLARLDRALSSLAPPRNGHELQWDIKNALKLRAQCRAIDDEERRRRIHGVLDEFEAHVAPVLDRLRRQVIHNDFNPHNILMSTEDETLVSGILDFGDIVETPLVIDLAVACSYQVEEGSHPLSSVGEFATSYHSVNPLEESEIDILFDLIRARLATTAVVTAWRAARYPANRDYIMRNNGSAWAAIDQLEGVGRVQARDYLAHACGMRVRS